MPLADPPGPAAHPLRPLDLPRPYCCQLPTAQLPGALGSEQAWTQPWLLARRGLERVEVGPWTELTQSRSQLHMAGYAGSAPKGSSGREVLLGPCLEPGQPLSIH